MGGKEFRIPLLDIVSVCALLVWQPADPNEAVTRLLFPGSAPQHKILEGLEKFKQLEFLKSPVFMAKDVAPAPSSAVITPSSTSSAFTKSPVKTKSSTSSSPRHTPIEPVPVKAAVRKEVSSSKPPPKSSDHSGSSNAKETDAKPPSRPATKIIKADVLSSSSRTGSAELRAKKTETAKPTAPTIKLSSSTTTKKETAVSNGETNKTLVPKIKKDVANMKMVEARVHSFKSPASLKRAEESTKNKKPTSSADDKDIKDKVQRSQSQSREKRSASSVRGQPDEEKTRVKSVKKIEASPASPAKTMTKPLIKAKPKETVSKPVESKATAIAKEPLKKDKTSTSTAARTKSAAPAKESSAKPASKAPAPTSSSSSSSTPSGKAVKRPVKAVAAAAATVVAVASVVTSEEQPTEEPTEVAVVEEDFNAASSPQHEASPSEEGDQVTDETNIIESIESQILEDVEAIEQQSQHESEPDAGNAEDETEQEKQEEQEQEEDEGGDQGSMAGDAEETEENAEKEDEGVEAEAEEEIAQVEDGEDEGTGSEEMEVADVTVSEEVVQTEEEVVEEKSNKDVTEETDDLTDDKKQEKEVDDVVEENEKQEEDDAAPVQDEEEMANEPIEIASIDDEVAVNVAQFSSQVDRSNDPDGNLETDESRDPIEGEEIQPAVTTSSVDAGRTKSASPQPAVTGDETAIIEDDMIDQSEQRHSLDGVQQHEIQKEEEIQAGQELEEETNEEKDVVDDKEEIHRPIVSPEPAVEVEEEIQAAVSSEPVETGRPTSVSPLAHEDNQDEDLEEEVDREKEVEEEKEMDHQEEESSSIEYQTIDKELDQEDYKHPVAIDCQVKEEDTEEIPTKENDNLIISGHVDIEKKVDDVDQHAGHHQEEALSSLSCLSDLEPTPVHDRSAASLYEEEQQLSSMESQPETHQFTQKSAPQMDEASPKDVQTKSSLVVVDDVPSGPSSVEVEEEFKAEIVVRPVPISVPLGVIELVAL